MNGLLLTNLSVIKTMLFKLLCSRIVFILSNLEPRLFLKPITAHLNPRVRHQRFISYKAAVRKNCDAPWRTFLCRGPLCKIINLLTRTMLQHQIIIFFCALLIMIKTESKEFIPSLLNGSAKESICTFFSL